MTKPEPQLQAFQPMWPRPSDDAARHAQWSYDRFSDTMMVHFFGKPFPAVAVPIEIGPYDYLYARVEPDTERVVGVQIEDFLAFAVNQHPFLAPALGFARLNGMTRAEADDILHRLNSPSPTEAHPASIATELIALCC